MGLKRGSEVVYVLLEKRRFCGIELGLVTGPPEQLFKIGFSKTRPDVAWSPKRDHMPACIMAGSAEGENGGG